MRHMHIECIAAFAMLLLMQGNGAQAQNYTLGTYSVNRVITALSSSGSSYAYSGGAPGGAVSATAASSNGGSTSASIEVEFAVTATYGGTASPPPTGNVTAKDTATGNGSSALGGSDMAHSGYEYSPWLRIVHSIAEANPYSFNESHGPYPDCHGTTTLLIIATAYAGVSSQHYPGS